MMISAWELFKIFQKILHKFMKHTQLTIFFEQCLYNKAMTGNNCNCKDITKDVWCTSKIQKRKYTTKCVNWEIGRWHRMMNIVLVKGGNRRASFLFTHQEVHFGVGLRTSQFRNRLKDDNLCIILDVRDRPSLRIMQVRGRWWGLQVYRKWWLQARKEAAVYPFV